MQWKKEKIALSDGTEAEAQAPVIISASRSTDIPAFMQIGLFLVGRVLILNGHNGNNL